jgi:hypothetical protein
MINKKRALRLGTLLCLLLFLLIPLLSSPVAAAFTFNLGSVGTLNGPAGPTAWGTIAGGNQLDNSPFNARFSVAYNYADANPGGTGSTHQMVVTVSWVRPNGMPGGGPFTYTQPLVTLPPGGSTSGTFFTGWINGYAGKGSVFSVYVAVTCTDLFSTAFMTWTSSTVTITII